MAKLEQFSYDNTIVKNFAYATILWGVVGMLAGLWAAFELIFPELNLGLPYITYGRLRPLHTNAAIFAFVGNGIFMGVYYSLQRLLKARCTAISFKSIPLLGLAGHHSWQRQ
jgi:cytochrome c oxidase cbb3-type subunit I/II